MNKKIKYTLVFSALAVSVFLIYKVQTQNITKLDGKKESQERAVPLESVKKKTYKASDFVWKAELIDEKDYVPRERVTLIVTGQSFSVGESANCNTEAQTSVTDGQVSYIRCWFGGAGDEISVFNENGNYVVKKRWIQESGGPVVNAPPYGQWEKILILP